MKTLNGLLGIIATPPKWGWCMDGNELIFTEVLCHSVLMCSNPDVKYLEIGVGRCGTMRAVCEVFNQMNKPARVIGLELESDPFFQKRCAPVTLLEYYAGHYPVKWYDNAKVQASILFKQSVAAFETDLKDEMFNVVFVDGCHCKDHTIQDFIACENHVLPGGTVIFHDASPMCQGIHTQSLCPSKSKITVRAALDELGLLSGTRPGWRTAADANETPHGIYVVQKSP